MNTQHDITAGGQTLDPPTPPRKPHKLLWIDLETTALSRTEARILEIGMIVTNLDGTEDGDRFILPVRPDHVSLYDIDPKVLRMHLDNGYVRWYELPDGSAAVRCFSDSGGASCDWEHIKLKDKQ